MKEEIIWAIKEYPEWDGIEEQLTNNDSKEVILEFRKIVQTILDNFLFEIRAPNSAAKGCL